MRKAIFLTVLLCIIVLVTESHAAEKKWSDEAELAFVDTSGNTEITTLSANNLLKYKFSEELLGEWKAGALYGKTDGVKTAESYFSVLRLDYLFTNRLYSFAMAGWSKDEFAGIDSRYYAGPGVGYKFLIGPKHFFLNELSINYVHEEYTNDTDEDYMMGRAFAKYEYAFTEKNRFSQSVEFQYDLEDGDNYIVISETALKSALNNYLSLKTSYVVKYDNEPVPATLKETDSVLSVTLVVNF